MKLPIPSKSLSPEEQSARNTQLAGVDPRRVPASYFLEHRANSRNALSQFLDLPKGDRTEALNLLNRDAAKLLLSRDANEVARGVAQVALFCAWDRLHRDYA